MARRKVNLGMILALAAGAFYLFKRTKALKAAQISLAAPSTIQASIQATEARGGVAPH